MVANVSWLSLTCCQHVILQLANEQLPTLPVLQSF